MLYGTEIRRLKGDFFMKKQTKVFIYNLINKTSFHNLFAHSSPLLFARPALS